VAVGDEVDTVGLGQEVERQCRELPRDSIATKALSHSYIVIVKDMAEVR
jgi:histidinol dehydrogenase